MGLETCATPCFGVPFFDQFEVVGSRTAAYHLLDFWPEPGIHVLRLECAGRSARSEGHFLGIESVRLRERRPRVEKYGRDRDRDWRRDPILCTKR